MVLAALWGLIFESGVIAIRMLAGADLDSLSKQEKDLFRDLGYIE